MSRKEETEGYFFRESEDGYGRVLVLRGPWQPHYKDLIAKEGVSGLRLSYSMGWRDTDLKFLRELKELRGVEIYSHEVQDASVIASLHKLQLVALDCDVRIPIDLAGLSDLQVVKATWRSAIESVLQCSGLRHLNLSNWPYDDLQPLAGMSHLAKLLLTSRKLSTLRGIGSLHSLEWLDLHACPKLKSVDDVRYCEGIWHLELTSCKAFRDISALGDLKLLRELHLENDGEIESLTPLRRCRKLERLSFWGTTRISDGKISAIEELPNIETLRFTPRRHYDRTRDQVLRRSRD